MKLKSGFTVVSLGFVIPCSLIGFLLFGFASGVSDFEYYYKIKVAEGDWVEYIVTRVVEKAIIPTEFEDSFPKNWASVNEGSLIRVDVLGKTDVSFGNYSREFAISNVTFNGQPLIPFWFYETIQTVQQLPFDVFSFFMPVNESYWNFLENLAEWLAGKALERGVQVTYDIQKCFYQLRIDIVFFGWIEVSANYDDYLGALLDLSLMFSFTPEFVNEVQQRIGTILVDGEPFRIEPSKKYGLEISLSDSNIPQLMNSIEYGRSFAEALNQAIEKGEIGAVVTIKSSLEGKGIMSRVDILVEQLNVSAYVVAEKISIEVNSTLPEGKVLIVNIRKDVFAVQYADEFQVLLDNEPIGIASDYNDVLNLLDEEAEYYVMIGSESAQIAISIPSFSTRTIEIIKVPSLTAKLIFYSIITGVICFVILGVYLLRRRIKHRNRQ